MLKLAPSILSADFKNLGRDLTDMDQAGAHYVHFDVMDGMFVPNISFGFPVMKSIRSATDKVFDVHLMVEDPGRFVETARDSGADLICVHAEACPHLNRTIAQIKETGAKAAVALNPASSLTALEYILGDLDMVLLMTVNPGFGGQSFIPNSLTKIRALRKMADEYGRKDLDIEVDGGITAKNVGAVIEAGANVIVAGSAVFNGDTKGSVQAFLDEFARYEA